MILTLFFAYLNGMSLLLSVWYRFNDGFRFSCIFFRSLVRTSNSPNSWAKKSKTKNFRCIFMNFKLSSCIFRLQFFYCRISFVNVMGWDGMHKCRFLHLNIVASVNCTFWSASVWNTSIFCFSLKKYSSLSRSNEKKTTRFAHVVSFVLFFYQRMMKKNDLDKNKANFARITH